MNLQKNVLFRVVLAVGVIAASIVLWRIKSPTEITAEIDALVDGAEFSYFQLDLDGAIKSMDRAIQLAEWNNISPQCRAELYTYRGQLIMLIYEWDRALADYNRAIELDPTYPDAYFHRGVLYYSNYVQVEYELARADFEHYLQLATDGTYAQQAADYIADIDAQLEALDGG